MRKYFQGRFIVHIALTVILFSVLAGTAAAQQSFNVVDVRVEGAKTASNSLILSVAGISKGDELTASMTQDAIKRLYGLGFFQDIEILADQVVGGLDVIIRVKELPKLRDLFIKGADKISAKDIREEIKISPNAYLSPSYIYDKKAKIEDYYAEKGYFMATASYKLDYSDDSTRADLTFNIKEGDKIKVEKVILTGNEQVPAGDIIGKMRNRKRGFLKSSNFDKEKYPEDKKKIIDYLHNQGYIDAYLISDSMSIDTSRNRMKIYLDIYEGPRYYFGDSHFSGNDILSEKRLEGALKYDKGKPFNSEKYEESLYELYFVYQEEGYLHVRILDEQTTRDSLIDLSYKIVEGLPSEVNLVKISGNTRTKEKVIRREMAIRPGQVFHRSLLIRSVRNIMQLNYFGNVTPDIVDLPSGDVDVTVEVEEKPTGQVSAGAGYSARDSFVGTFGLGIPNFRGMGQALNFNLEWGSDLNSYSVSFTEPWLFGTPTLIGTDLYYTNRRWYSDYTEGRRGGSVRLGRRLKWPDDYFSTYIRYRIEDDRFYDFSDSYIKGNSNLVYDQAIDPSLPPADTIWYQETKAVEPLPGSLEKFGGDWFTSSSVTFSVTRDSRDLPEFATKGSVVSYTITQTGGIFGGYWKYQKHELEVSKFIPIYKSIALAGKLSLGGIRASDDRRILEFERYSPGGTGYDGIVRGYEDGSLTPDTTATIDRTYNYYYFPYDSVTPPDFSGPPDDSTTTSTTYVNRVRGKYQIVANLELQIPILPNQLYMLGFFDAGNSWLHRSDIKLNEVYRGVGVGFRLVVPGIGTIGFDFGYPLDKRYGQDQNWKPHFQIGTTFR